MISVTQLSTEWFPPYTKPLSDRILVPCLHCGEESPRIYEKTGKIEREFSTSESAVEICIYCKKCGFGISFGRSLEKNSKSALKELAGRARTMMATYWNGRNAQPPFLSYGEWKAGLAFYPDQKPPEWDALDIRQDL